MAHTRQLKFNAVGNTTDRWEEFLNPQLLREKLIAASIYLAAYELLTNSIVERIENFFTDFDGPAARISSEYKTEVLRGNTSPVCASLSWLKENGAIDESDLKAFESIKKCRNELAHELSQILSGAIKGNFLTQYSAMIELLKKIEVWWIVNFEIPTNPNISDAEVDTNGIVPGPVWSLQLMLDVALGEPERASFYLEEFKKRKIRRH